ncbi:MAG: helix-turn-helix transcriptional regulator [Acidimicrobiales bacterium]
MQRFAGHQLRQARKSAGQVKERAALMVGRSYSTITLYESGRVIPPAPIMCRLADLYGCKVEEFFEEADRVAS